MRTYSTLPEAVQREVIDPIEASGVVADARAEFDVDAIAEEVIAWHGGAGEPGGARTAGRPGFRCEYANDPGPFWQIVERHAIEVAS